jgi:hypothetical protein
MLNKGVFADAGMSAAEPRALIASIETLRHNAGAFWHCPIAVLRQPVTSGDFAADEQ